MTRDATIATVCIALALVAIVGAFRCLAERLLPSAAIYTLLALALFGGGLRAALAAL